MLKIKLYLMVTMIWLSTWISLKAQTEITNSKIKQQAYKELVFNIRGGKFISSTPKVVISRLTYFDFFFMPHEYSNRMEDLFLDIDVINADLEDAKFRLRRKEKLLKIFKILSVALPAICLPAGIWMGVKVSR